MIIPGHGPIGNVDDLRRALDTIENSRAIVRAGLAKQLSDEEIALQLTDYQSWGQGFISIERWINIIRADQQAFPEA